MRTATAGLVCALAALWVARAEATPGDRVGHGSVVVAQGEQVGDAVALGGSLTVRGWVTGDAVAFGGSVRLLPGARVDGDVTAFGGSINVEPGAVAMGDRTALGERGRPGGMRALEGPNGGVGSVPASESFVERWLKNVRETTRDLIRHVAHMFGLYLVLILLGAVMLGVAPLRTRALAATVAAHPVRSLGLGLLVSLVAAIVLAILAVTVVGIPAAAVIAAALGIAALLGLTAVSILVGELLPIESLRGRHYLKLLIGAGVLVMLISIPYVGGVIGLIATILGLGSVAFTRMRPGHLVFNEGRRI